MDRCARAGGFRFGLLFLLLADRPRRVRGLSTRCRPAGCSSCSTRVLASRCFDPSSWVFSVGVSLPDYPPGVAGLSHYKKCVTF
jgi:hypothetical protein